MSTRRVSLIITILILGIGVTWFHGKTKADSQRVQNPENGHWYQRINASMSWNGAKSYCLAQGGHLVTIGSASENAFVYNLASGAWLGATDQEQEGNWHWVTGEPWTYTNWAPYEPNNGTWPGHDGDEDYMNFTPAYPGQWNDIPDGNANFVCEWEKNISLSATYTTISPDGQTKLTVRVTENGVLVANAKVKVEVQVTDGSGGHQHSDIGRPRGCLTYNGNESLLTTSQPSVEVTTDSAGKAIVIFKPGKDIDEGCQRRGIAGNYEVIARLTDSPSTYDRQIIVAKVSGLVPFSGCVHCILDTKTHNHTNGQYATTTTLSGLISLADLFYAATGQPLSINDISLPDGGLYDYRQNWKGPHFEHGNGTAVDFNKSAYSLTDTITLRRLGCQFGWWADDEYKKDGNLHLDFNKKCPRNWSPNMSALANAPDLFVDIIPLDTPTLIPGANQVISYTIGFGNFGTAEASNTVLTVTLPGALTLVSANPLPSGGTNCQPIWKIGTIGAGGVPQIITLNAVVNSNVTPGTEFTTTVQISSDEPDVNLADNLAEFSLTSYPLGADLNVSSEIEPGDVTPGQTSTFTITVANYGNVDAPGTVLTLTIPSQLEVLSTSPMSTSYQANNIIWQLGNLPVNRELPVTVTLYTPPNIAVGSLLTYTLHSRSEAPDINVNDNSMQVVYQVEQTGVDAGVTLDVRGMHEDGNFSVGETITYTIYYGNYGNQIPDSYSRIDFRLGNGLVFLSAKPHDSSVITGTISEYGGTWYIPNLPINSTDYIEVFAQVTSIPGEGCSAYAIISQWQDINLTNNTDYELRFKHMDRIYLPIVLR